MLDIRGKLRGRNGKKIAGAVKTVVVSSAKGTAKLGTKGAVYAGQRVGYELEKQVDPDKAKIRRQGQLNRFRKSQGVTVKRKKVKRKPKVYRYSYYG